MASIDDQLSLLMRGVAQVEPASELRKKLERSAATGRPLRVKYGIDPTGISVHLGHTVPLRKLRQFQEFGHKAVLIIGNYTALVGDPSGRDQARARLTPEQVEANARDYLTQIRKVIDLDQAEVHPNGSWFSRFTFLDVMALMSQITVQRMLERDDFSKRVAARTPIYLHECLYPLMQARDSVEIQADIELGGSEQLFNLMLGRQLQQDAGQEPQVCMTFPILRGLDGVRRMGKSLGNYIGIGESAYDMFAKTMSIPDSLMREWAELLTSRSESDIAALTDPAQTHPMEAKKSLAAELVSFYHSAEAAQQARTEWEKRFSEKQDPTEIPEVAVPISELTDGKIWICKLLTLAGITKSNGEGRRLLGPNSGVTIGPDREKITDDKAQVSVTDGLILRSGSKRIVKIRLS